MTFKVTYGKILLMAGAVALAILFWYDPVRSGIFPKCPFLMLTGYKCPGCGSQRAVHALLHGDFRSALGLNALLLFSLPYLVAGLWLEWFGGKDRYPSVAWRFFGPAAARVWLIVVLGWWLLRNLASF